MKMYTVATPPAEQPEIYELRSDMEEDGDEWFVRMVSETSALWFRMDAGDDDRAGEVCWPSDPLMDWYHGLPSTLYRCQSISGEDDTFYVRAVPAGQLVVLDS